MIDKKDIPELWRRYQQIIKSKVHPPVDDKTDPKTRLVWILSRVSDSMNRAQFETVAEGMADVMQKHPADYNDPELFDSETTQQLATLFNVTHPEWAPDRDKNNRPIAPEFLDVEPPPVQSSAVEAPPIQDVSSLSSSRTATTSSVSFLDKIQIALDAIGVVEPTPFADAANAGISMMRAVSDRENAGQHMMNAAVSLAGMIPYFGDIAKVGKTYGRGSASITGVLRGASNRKSGSGNGLGGLLVNTMLGGLGSPGHRGHRPIFGTGGGGAPPTAPTVPPPGGGGGGGGHTPPPAPPGGGGAGGGGPMPPPFNPPGGQGGVPTDPSEMLPGGFRETFQNAIGSLALFVSAVQAATGWIGKMVENGRELLESNRGLAMYSGVASVAYANYDLRAVQRDIRTSQVLGRDLADLAGSQANVEDSWNEYTMPYREFAVNIQELVNQVSGVGLFLAKYMDITRGVLMGINALVDLGEKDDKDVAKNPIDAAIRADAIKVPSKENKLPSNNPGAKVI